MSGVLGSLLECRSAFLLKRRLKIIPDSRPSSDMAKFRNILKESKSVLILTGAGMSAESGLPTFRGAGGYWRKVDTSLATPEAFKGNPSMVWEFYHYRRELSRHADPNTGHIAIAEFEKRSEKVGRSVTVVTQNIDNLHTRAGSQNVIELHGNVFKTRCTKCKNIEVNNDSPICPALNGRGVPDPDAPKPADIPVDQLPQCKIPTCLGLLRPHVIWFGENLESDIIEKAHAALNECDACLIIGTSSIIYPAAMFAPQAASRGIPVAEFNIEPTLATNEFGYYFEGLCGTTVPQVLDF